MGAFWEYEAITFILDLSSKLLLIIPAGAGLVVTYQSTRKIFANNESDIAECNKIIKNTLIGSAIALSISGFVNILKIFFKTQSL